MSLDPGDAIAHRQGFQRIAWLKMIKAINAIPGNCALLAGVVPAALR